MLLLLSCSDYGLGGKATHAEDSRPEDVTWPETDSGRVVDSGGTDPTGTVAEPPVDGKVDVVLLIDVAYVYDCYHADLALGTAQLLDALFSSGADVAVAIATYDDYQVDGEWFAAWGGLPYVLRQQLTTDRARLDAVAAGLSLEWGGDGPGTGYEAIVQAATGAGFDQDCDGRLDASNDIEPYQASARDAFGGAVTGVADSSVPGTGTDPGVGFRSGSRRVIVLFAENAMRDRAYNHEFPTGVCLGTASRTDAADAVNNQGAKLLGVNSYEFWDIDSTPQDQLESLSDLTSSRIDSDGDGARDDRAVLWGSWDWPPTAQLEEAIWDLASP